MPPTPSQCTATSNIEVCQGPDCFGAGGGAALLAVEDLLLLDPTTETTTVAAGGCRNRCSMGPNVYVTTCVGSSTNGLKREEQEHFTKVASLADCRNVLRRCAKGNSVDDNSNPSSSTTATAATISPVLAKLRQRQADQKHWHALRLMARIRKSPVQVATQQQETARAAVEQAVGAVTAVANEQQHRLKGILERILEDNAQLSSSSESEGGSDEDEGA